jgi:hypothetical protein
MGSFSNYWENKILDHIFNKASYSAATIYLGLSTADPGESGSGLAEPSGNGYQRKQTSASDWTSSSGGALSNVNELAFPEATGSWGTITHFALFDTASGGNMLAHGALSISKTITAGDTAKFAAGELDVTLD